MSRLSEIRDPAGLRKLTVNECTELADDIRTKIIQTVSQSGGHLSSNLGVVEITIALHRAFETPKDQIIFDVGHQTYAHKLLTGRYERFDTLRQFGGLSGFPKRSESAHDCFETGHASTAISAALGMARARDAQGKNHHVIAVVGDGALTGGMCYEALNDCGNDHTRLIIVLNDNEMSIARNVGALSIYFSKLRASQKWNTTKKKVKSGLHRLPAIGRPLESFLRKIKQSIKSLIVDEGFFSALGFRYLGPIDGHNLETLEAILQQAKHFEDPVVIHCATKKGYGYYGAERNPDVFHGTPPFFLENGKSLAEGAAPFGQAAVEALIEQAREDPRIVIITAAMPLGTSTDRFQEVYPARFFDVGIAEAHAVTLSAGMARGGMSPFFFVYSTFLQRGYDQVMHDICMQNLPVTLLVDRAGLSNEDGESHQGLYDIAYLRHIPNLILFAPASTRELRAIILSIPALERPCAVRYPKTAVSLGEEYQDIPFVPMRWQSLRTGKDGTLLAVGSMVKAALLISEALKAKGLALEVVNASTVKPLDGECLGRIAAKRRAVFTLEEHMLMGGFGSAVLEWNAIALPENRMSIFPLGVKDAFIPHGDHASLLKYVGLDHDSILETVEKTMARENTPE